MRVVKIGGTFAFWLAIAVVGLSISPSLCTAADSPAVAIKDIAGKSGAFLVTLPDRSPLS
jgi:hypothetical protein